MESVSSRAASLRSALNRGLWLTVVLTLLLAGAGGALGWNRQRDARAESVILLNPLDGNAFSTTGRGDSLTNLETEAQLARSITVAEQVRSRLNSSATPEELLDGLGVNAPTNTQLLTVTYTDPDPDEAIRRAQAFAEEFLAFREARSRDQVDAQVSLLESQVKDLQAEQSTLASELLKPKLSAAEKSVLQAQLDAATTQINQLRARRSELQVGPFNPGQIVTPAALRREGLLDSWVAYAAIGAIAGLVLSLLIAIVRARLDSRVHHVDDVALSGRTLLGEIDAADAMAVNPGVREPVILPLPVSYRELRVSLLTSRRRRPLVLLAASSSSSATQPPRFAPGLALSMAAARLRTVVVDALGIWPLPRGTAAPDLAGYLAALGEADAGPQPLVVVSEFLSVVAAGELTAPDDVFMSPAMAQLLTDLRQDADVIVLIGGGLGSSAARALADLADVVLTEVREGESSYRDLTLANPALEAKDAGVVYMRRSSAREARRRVRTEPKRPWFRQRPGKASTGDRTDTTILARNQPEPESDEVAEVATDGGPDGPGPDAVGHDDGIVEGPGQEVVEDSGPNDSGPTATHDELAAPTPAPEPDAPGAPPVELPPLDEIDRAEPGVASRSHLVGPGGRTRGR